MTINLQNIQAAYEAQYRKNEQPNQKLGKRAKQTFKEDTQMTNKHMKRCSVPIIREMYIKTTVGYDFVPIRMAII